MVFLKLRCGGVEINSNNDIRGGCHSQVRRRIKEIRGKNRDSIILMVIDFTGEHNMSSFERETVR